MLTKWPFTTASSFQIFIIVLMSGCSLVSPHGKKLGNIQRRALRFVCNDFLPSY